MRRLIVLFLCLFLTIMTGACGAPNTPSESKTTPGAEPTSSGIPAVNTAEVQKQEEIQISITPPEGWKPVVGSVIPVQYMKNTASFMVKEEGFRGDTLDEVIEQAKDVFDSVFDEVKYVSEAESITVDGKDARKVIFTCVISKMQMKYEFVYLFAGGNVYAITFADIVDTFDSLSADYEQILSDIRFG